MECNRKGPSRFLFCNLRNIRFWCIFHCKRDFHKQINIGVFQPCIPKYRVRMWCYWHRLSQIFLVLDWQISPEHFRWQDQEIRYNRELESGRNIKNNSNKRNIWFYTKSNRIEDVIKIIIAGIVNNQD